MNLFSHSVLETFSKLFSNDFRSIRTMLSRLMLFKRSSIKMACMSSTAGGISSSISKDKITYRRLTPSDEDISVDLMRRCFIKNEVINKYVLKYNEAAIDCDAHRLKIMLAKNASTGAFYHDKMIGMSILKIDAKYQHFEDSLPVDMRQKLPLEWEQVCIALNSLYKEFYEKIAPRRVLESQMMAVEPAYTCLGVGMEMSKRAIEVAAKTGCDYIMTITCSKPVQLLTVACGAEKLGEIVYHDYRDPQTGCRPFRAIPLEHPSSILFYIDLKKHAIGQLKLK